MSRNLWRVSKYFHGGVPGLRPGDILRGGHGRKMHDGCPFCEARAAGGSLDGIDPASAREAVYITTDKGYAKHYASLYGRGDLYAVEPIGPLTPSEEDHFPSWTTEEARIVAVHERGVLLTMREREALGRRWEIADIEAAVRP